MTTASAAISAPQRVRPFYWSVRRELFENPAIWIAPLAVEAVVLTAFFVASFSLPKSVARAAAGGMSNAQGHFHNPYAAAAGALFVVSFLVAIFYSLSALHAERRDRSVLFWKSLPVSDLTTVLAKAAIPLVVQNVIILALAVTANLIMLAWSTVLLLAHGMSPMLLYRYLNLPFMWTVMAYGLAFNALWDVAFYGWLLLVSAWAKRMTFVWAVAPWLGLALFEYLAFHTRHVLHVLSVRIFGGFAQAYSVGGEGKAPIQSFVQIDLARMLSDPNLWIGLVFGVACLAGCVWLRRRNQPL